MIYDLILIIILIIFISIYIYVKNLYKKYSKINLDENYSGFESARKILDEKGLDKVYIIKRDGFLLDYLDIKNNALYLCKENFDGENISSFLFSSYYAMNKPSYNIKLILNIFTNGIFIGLFLGLLTKNTQLYTGMVICLALLLIIKIYICYNNSSNIEQITKKFKNKNKQDIENINNAVKMIYLEPIFIVINNIVENFKAIIWKN